MIDTNKLYLFHESWGNRYAIGKIRRINTKTVTMDNGDKIEIDKLDQELYQLTEQEENLYKSEVIKKLSRNTRNSLEDLVYTLKNTKYFLEKCEFLDLNTEKIQKYIDEMTDDIKKKLDLLSIEINGKNLKINEEDYNTHGMIKVKGE